MRNRKKTLQVTVEEMRNFSFAYIERYAPSKQQLRTYLLKKYLKANLENIKKQDITDLIDVVLQDLEKTKFINDKFYSDQDFFSGIKICKKKRIGPARVEDNRVLFYKKDIALLARNGFDFETSKRIMDIDQADYMKIIRLL
jgi:regulatory protein